MATERDNKIHVARFMRGIIGSDSILGDPRPQIAFVGRSNVGKSSTLNMLLGTSIARVSSTPGKTQEINFFEVDKTMYFVDLPGYGFARMPDREREKIRKHILWYLASGEAHPRLVVLILDAKVGATDLDAELITLVRERGYQFLILLNKADKLNQKERSSMMRDLEQEFPGGDILFISAKNGEGKSEIWKRIVACG
jgi:GTP-binding protein